MGATDSEENKPKSISELSLDELRGWVIDRVYQIEVSIDRIISDYYEPVKKEEFRKIILNSSIITLGSKTKILSNIEGFDKKIIGKIQQIISIRNAFAHLPTKMHVEVKGKKDKGGNFTITNLIQSSKMEVMNSSGQLKQRDLSDLRKDFYQLNQDIRSYILEYIKNET